MNYENIIFDSAGPVASITINRPEKLNALNTQTFKELEHALNTIIDSAEIKGLFIKGSGSKAFVAGADILEIQPLDEEAGRQFSLFGQKVFSMIEHLPVPTIALIDGFALGGGMELAMACHIRMATERSKFGQPEVNLGLIPGYGGTQRLPRLVGRGLALELLLTADMINASRAFQMGLVNRVVASTDELISSAQKMMDKVISKGPIAIKNILKIVHEGLNNTLEAGLDLEADYFGKTCATHDMKEGTSAFIEKRDANFTGK